MDSGNSGSIQSSSGNEEEYDSSRAASFPHLSNPPPPQHHHPSALFDPLPNYFDPNPLPSFDPIWPKSPLNCTYNSLPNIPSSGALFTSSSASPTVPKTDPAQPQLGRNPKKRSRASRRAPTTVLTTDTANFRAMVQEFTGIPAPPFTSSISSSPFVRTNRLDLFGVQSTRSYPLPDALQPPPYLLRPFAQKFQPPPPQPFLGGGPNSHHDVVSGNSNNSNNNSNSVNYQMQNPILTFQSLLQSPPSVIRSGGQGMLDVPSENDGEVNPAVWGGGVGLNGGDQSHHLRPVNGSYVDYSSQSGGGGKGNYEKGSENVGAGRGGGGMVESWICSSDH